MKRLSEWLRENFGLVMVIVTCIALLALLSGVFIISHERHMRQTGCPHEWSEWQIVDKYYIGRFCHKCALIEDRR